VEHGFEQATALGLRGGELCFELIAERQELIDFGDDAVLLGEGWEGNQNVAQIRSSRTRAER